MLIKNEIRAAVSLWRYILYSAFLKITLRNAGSKLGLLWEPLSTLLVSVILSLVWIRVLGIQGSFHEYFIYVYCGMIIWGGISSAVSNLCGVLANNAQSITSRSLPIFSYIFEDILVSFIPLLMSLPFVMLFILVGDYSLTPTSLLNFLGGLILVLLASFSFALSVGLSAFFIGDIRQVITAVMRLAFLVTPVIWKADRLAGSEYLLMLNPFYGYLHILRGSLTGAEIQTQYVFQAIGITLFLSALGMLMFKHLHKKIQHRALML